VTVLPIALAGRATATPGSVRRAFLRPLKPCVRVGAANRGQALRLAGDTAADGGSLPILGRFEPPYRAAGNQAVLASALRRARSVRIHSTRAVPFSTPRVKPSEQQRIIATHDGAPHGLELGMEVGPLAI
jgi:hypothetical protein